jgi:serine/threonine-protein kinase
LRNLSVVLPQKDTAGGAATQPAWIDAFREAGLNAAEFQASSSEWVPPMAYDARMAWTGPVRVEAAAYRGKLVYFEVVPAWRVPRRQAIVTGFPMQFWVLAPVFLSVLGVGGWAALRNLRAGRGDRRGALRLAVFVFGARMVAWAFSAHHIPGIDELTDLLLTGLESAAFWAASVGVVYLALEPMLRRHWPERLIGWSRLLAGEYRDPLVGRDVLVGTLFAAAALLVTEIANAAHRWLGLSPIGPHVFVGSAMIGIGGFLPYTMNAAITALVQSLLIVFVMFLPSLLLRQEWASRGVAFVVLCAMLLPSKTYRGTHYLPWEMVTVLLLMIAVLHFGALTGAVTLFVIHMQVFFPITTELTAWYARGFGLFLLLVAAIAAWGARASLAGRPLFGPRFLEE